MKRDMRYTARIVEQKIQTMTVVVTKHILSETHVVY